MIAILQGSTIPLLSHGLQGFIVTNACQKVQDFWSSSSGVEVIPKTVPSKYPSVDDSLDWSKGKS